ncbi:MAG: tRNA (N(6)-L-threonylcarbamoyladenosine(37)-C(2))-methylthiotransferase MtaB [Alphaproteobacteria bacterium]|nr:tRNA (N(6)-L-threonylcarbamoyladenosine(37)-C(2))-methylthiotransferase MtaB [Alphaproteobacteria bacterium]
MPAQIVTFGCRLNTYESSAMQELGNLPDNIIIVNTCAVTGEAERQCRQAIRKLKRENPDAFVVVTGCAAQVHPELYAQMPEVSRVLGNREKFKVENFAPEQPDILVSDIDSPVDFDLPEPVFFNERCRAFIQIQQGCNNHCTFCIVPQARGKSSYLPAEKILRHAEKLIEQGYPEIVLTGVDITDYPNFAKLVESLTQIDGLKRVRLGSLDPACIHDDLIALFKRSYILQPHVHLSAQSGDNMILKRMARRHTREDILELCQKLRAVRPDIVFGADFITGFPTETDQMFSNTLDLVKEAGITHLHVFPYSIRPGTPAAKMPQIPAPVRKERAKILRTLGENLLFDYMQGKIGQTAVVLYEADGKGLCEHYLPVFVGNGFTPGDFVSVRLAGIENGIFKGSVL